ncbi:MAG: tetratricopeptide repeat protein [Acetobacteraceae bacterium]
MAGGLLALAGPARAQMITSREGIALQNQILELRHELHMLQAQSGGTGGSVLAAPQPLGTPAGPAAADSKAQADLVAHLLLRVTRLEGQVRDLRGQIDTLSNALNQKIAALDKKIGDLAFQVQQGGAGGGPAAPAAPAGPPAAGKPAALGPAPAAPPAGFSGTPAAVLRQGYAALARHDDKTALAAARYVLKGKDAAAGYDAQFLKAQALAASGDWQHAALAYDDLYNRNKTGPRAEDALLGLGESFTAIGARSAACSTLDSLRSQFPTPRADLKPRIAAARKRAGCH